MVAGRTEPNPWLRLPDLPLAEALVEVQTKLATLHAAGAWAQWVEGLLWQARLEAHGGRDAQAGATLAVAEAQALRLRRDDLFHQAVLTRAGIDADFGRHARAVIACQDISDAARARDDAALVRQALFVSAASLGHLGEHDLAVETYEEARMLLKVDPAALDASDRRLAAGRLATGQAQVWLMRGGLLLEAAGRGAAAEALERARQLSEQACETLLGASPRFSHAALFGLARVLLEADEVDTALRWLKRVGEASPTSPPADSVALAFWRLSQAMVHLRSGAASPQAVLENLQGIEGVPHPRVTGGDLRLSHLRCLFEACEQARDHRRALMYQRQWAEAKGRLRTRLAREHVQWTEQTLAGWRAEAGAVVTSALREPLELAVAGLEEADAEDELSSDAQVSLRRASHSVRRAIDIADQYLGVMRAEHMRVEDLQTLDLAALVDDVCEQMAPPANGNVRLEKAVERMLFIRGDRILLMRALGNLLSNAFKHAPAGSAVSVRLVRCGDEARLSVGDEGPGLPLDMRARLFQRFATGAVRKGNGLGLAMVARAVRVHRARVVVDSAPGGGTRIHLALGLVDVQ